MSRPHTRVLAIDPGQARLGLAVSDPDRKIASPLANYTRNDAKQDGRYVKKVVDDEEIGLIVIGLPVHVDGVSDATGLSVPVGLSGVTIT